MYNIHEVCCKTRVIRATVLMSPELWMSANITLNNAYLYVFIALVWVESASVVSTCADYFLFRLLVV